MQNPKDDSLDATVLFEPGAAFATVAMAAPVVPTIDVHEIADLAALSPLVAAANPLLLMVPTLRRPQPPADVAVTRSRLIGMLRNFDAATAQLGLPEDQRSIARYALCTMVDEAILMTPWGTANDWLEQSLLQAEFRENAGGEKFFQLLDKLSQSPDRFKPLLELFYACLALGFMGRFREMGAPGRQAVTAVRERLYALIRRSQDGEEPRTLAMHWQGVDVEPRRFKGFTTVGVAAAACALIGLAAYAWFSFALAARVDAMELGTLALKPPEPSKAAMAPAPKPRLVQLLGPEIAAGQISVRDMKLESTVTILGETVFESGSAAPTPRSEQLLRRIAAALDQVDGQVVVTGHTDNVPTRTLRHASNFALSKERAAHVKRLVESALKDGSRVSAEGKGETEPVASNATAEGRARNRRVEITLRVPAATQ